MVLPCPQTNILFLENVLRHPEFLSGAASTSFIDRNPELFQLNQKVGGLWFGGRFSIAWLHLAVLGPRLPPQREVSELPPCWIVCLPDTHGPALPSMVPCAPSFRASCPTAPPCWSTWLRDELCALHPY